MIVPANGCLPPGFAVVIDALITHRWLGNNLFAAVAWAGCAFDPGASINRRSDTVRWAQVIQSARDAQDYRTADDVREKVGALGLTVRLGRDYTFIVEAIGIDGDNELLGRAPHWPSYDGYRSFVAAGDVNGRHILETIYLDDTVHSYAVANWQDHPNLGKAVDGGWPPALWSHAGQQALYHSISAWWAFAQIDALLSAKRLKAINAIFDEMLKLRKQEMTE